MTNTHSTAATLPVLPGKAERVSTRIVFFVIGLGGAAWAPLVPFAKNRTELNEGQLGLLLLCLGAGSIIAMPLAGTLAARFGCRRVIVLASALIGLNVAPVSHYIHSAPTCSGPVRFWGGGGVGRLCR